MTAPTTHKATAELGASVVNNKLVWTSATGITSADPHSFGGCLRKFFYDQVMGLKDGATEAMKKGTELHDEIEEYELRGGQITSPLAMAGARFIPKPGSGIYIERPVAYPATPPGLGIGATWLYAGDIPVAGHIDLQNLRGEYIDEDGKLVQDEPKTLETKDWKTTSSFEYAKTPHELSENIQLITYAEAGFNMEPEFELARLTHVYFLTRGRPESKLVTIRVDRNHVSSRWKYASSVVRTMEQAATETNPDKVTANTKACGAYRGCPHRARCTAHRSTSLDSLYGKVANDLGDLQVGLLSNNPQIMQTAPQQTQPQVDMRAQLAAEEQQLRAQQAQLAPPSASVADAWQRIEGHRRGTPALGSNAAQAFAASRNIAIGPHAGYAGTGELGGIMLSEPAHIFQLADELDGKPAAAPPPPPPAPAPMPYTPGQIAAPMPTSGNQMPTAGTMSILPPGAPESRPELAMARPEADAPPADPVLEPIKKKAGRPPKTVSSTAPATEAGTSAPPAAAAVPPSPPASASQGVPSGAVLTSPAASTVGNSSGFYVDCIPNTSFRLLHTYVAQINAELARRYCVDDAGRPTVQDIRCAPPKSILAFGGWKGCVRDIVLANPPPIDMYVLDTRDSEIAQVVASALLEYCDKNGVDFVRGMR